MRRIIALSIAVLPLTAHAYRTAGDDPVSGLAGRVRWPTPTLSIALIPAHPAGTHLADVEHALQTAALTWSSVECARVRVSYDALVDPPLAPEDGRITVEFIDDEGEWARRGYAADMAATTDVVYESGANGPRIVDADVFLNGAGFAWGDGAQMQRDLTAVLTHEIGHVLGLLHPCEPNGAGPSCDGMRRDTVMDPIYHGISQRTLTDDDVAGVCFLYPRSLDCSVGGCGSALVGDPCDVDVECASGVCGAERTCTTSCASGACDLDSCDTTAAIPECRSPLGTFGEPCDAADACASSVCLVHAAQGLCSRRCNGDCPADFECRAIDGAQLCAPRHAGASCAVTPHAPSSFWPLALSFLLRLRRKREPS